MWYIAVTLLYQWSFKLTLPYGILILIKYLQAFEIGNLSNQRGASSLWYLGLN